MTQKQDILNILKTPAKGVTYNHKPSANNLLVGIIFPKSLPTQYAAAFLDYVDAAAFSPFYPIISSQDYPIDYVFVAQKSKLDQFLDFANTIARNKQLSKLPDIEHIFTYLADIDDKIELNNFNAEDSLNIKDMLTENCNILQTTFNNISSIRDKINFIYLLCSGVSNETIPESALKNIEIYKQFIIRKISEIENTKSPEKQIELCNKLIQRVFFEEPDIISINDRFKKVQKNLGVLKYYKTLSMSVILSDGTLTDMFQLDTSKRYRIIHSVDIRKINQFVDFSKYDINGDFVCSKAKVPIILPNRIYGGGIDCSYCCDNFITPETRIPDNVTYINFTGTINNFDDLAKITLPESVNKIFLLNSCVNLVLKDDNAMSAFKKFTAKYPNIEIYSGNHKTSLQEILKQNDADKNIIKEPVVKEQPVFEKPVIPQKTDDWLTRKEIITLLKQDEQFEDIDNLERLVQRAINANHCIVASEIMLVDGVKAQCIHIKHIDTIKVAIWQIIDVDNKRTSLQSQTIQKSQPIKTIEQPKQKKKPQTVRIDKFIPKQVWKDLCSSCNDSSQLLYSVLKRINEINLDYTKQKGAVKYIDKNGQIQTSKTINKKEGCAAAQSIEENSDRRRIVWTINPKDRIIVAIKFLPDHADNQSKEIYKTARMYAAKGFDMNGYSVNRNLVIENGYYKVSDLLNQYQPVVKPEQNVSKQPTPTDQSTTKEKNITKCNNLSDVKALETNIKAMIKTAEATIAHNKKMLKSDNITYTTRQRCQQELNLWLSRLCDLKEQEQTYCG